MVTEEPFFEGESLQEFSRKNAYSGAIVSFSGKVRIDKHEGEDTQALYLEAYEPITSAQIEKKRAECIKRWRLDDAFIRHRTGQMNPGETIVFVVTAAKHRRDAFLAADFLMDYLKTEAFFWKKEISGSGSKWIEPKHTDYHDAKRWITNAAEDPQL